MKYAEKMRKLISGLAMAALVTSSVAQNLINVQFDNVNQGNVFQQNYVLQQSNNPVNNDMQTAGLNNNKTTIQAQYDHVTENTVSDNNININDNVPQQVQRSSGQVKTTGVVYDRVSGSSGGSGSSRMKKKSAFTQWLYRVQKSFQKGTVKKRPRKHHTSRCSNWKGKV